MAGKVEISYRVLVKAKTLGFTPVTGETLKMFEQKDDLMGSLGPPG